jgi:hypothetical protein
MGERICENCKKKFSQKSNYVSHLNRKFPCKTVIDKEVPDKYKLLELKINELQEQIKELKINELQEQIEELKKTGTITKTKTITNIDNKKILNIFFSPNAFGREDLTFIDDKTSKKILNKGFNSLQELIKTVHFNKDKPENHNIYMPNWRDKTKILVFDGEQWNLESKDEILEDLRDNGISFIQKKYDELDETDKKDAIIIKKIKRFIENYDSEERIDILNNDLQLILYNGREIVKKTMKTIKN